MTYARPVTSNGRIGQVVTFGLFGIGMLSLLRYHVLPGPAKSLGDIGDGAILIATLEHWRQVFRGETSGWLSAYWFWPAKDVLAFTDTYFLMALPYAAARWLGAGLFSAFDAVIASFAVIGYWSFVALARALGSGRICAAAFAAVFAFGSLVTFKLGHAQTYAAMLLPLIALLLVWAWRGRGLRGAGWAGLGGIVAGLLALTAPQTVWFLGFDTLLWLGLMGGLLVAWQPPGMAAWWRPLRDRWPQAAGGLAGLAVGLVPAILTYGETVHHERAWPEVEFFLPRVADFFQVQPGNMLWHHLFYRFGLGGELGRPVIELALSFTPGVLITLLVCVIVLGYRRRKAPGDAAVLAMLLTPVLAAGLTLEVDGMTAWSWIYDLLPGAGGLRTPFRVQVVSSFPLCLGLAVGVSAGLRAAWMRAWRGGALALGALVGLCVVEQANTRLVGRDDAAELAWLAAAERPPAGCDVFYVLPTPPSPVVVWPIQQADAMLLAESLHMPTVNGNSSWPPRDWDLFDPGAPGYGRAVLRWIGARGQGRRFCGVDPRAGRWVEGTGPLQGGE